LRTSIYRRREGERLWEVKERGKLEALRIDSKKEFARGDAPIWKERLKTLSAKIQTRQGAEFQEFRLALIKRGSRDKNV